MAMRRSSLGRDILIKIWAGVWGSLGGGPVNSFLS
jgi:hypothetical protein